MVNGKKVEIRRTTYNKTHDDLLKCTELPAHSEICFMDDTYYPGMMNKNVYYINIKPYYYDLSLSEMMQRFKKSNVGRSIIGEDANDIFDKIMHAQFRQFRDKYRRKEAHDYSVDKAIGERILIQLHDFFENFNGGKLEKIHKKSRKNGLTVVKGRTHKNKGKKGTQTNRTNKSDKRNNKTRKANKTRTPI